MELRTILIRSPRNSWDAAFLLVCADRDNDLNWIGYAMFRFHKHATRTHETQTTKSNIFTSFSYCQNQLRKVPDNTASTRFRQLVKRSMWNFEITKYPPNIYDFLLIIRIWDLIHDKIPEFFLVILLFHSLLDVTVVIFKLLRLLRMHRYFIHCWFLLWSHLH